jgi:deoxyribodipyrimidine photo-lyase
MKNKIIHWFRQDLRLGDNPALSEAASQGLIMPVYILDDENAGDYKPGAASRLWLHHALLALDKSLGNRLCVYAGKAEEILPQIVKENEITAVYWNRCYEPWRIKRDKMIKKSLAAIDIDSKSFNGSLLWEPWDISKNDGTPYKVFTPFYRKGCLNASSPAIPLPEPKEMEFVDNKDNSGTIESLQLLPKIKWSTKIEKHWDISEKGALEKLNTFLKAGIVNYKEGRNFPGQSHCSQLSPFLHFGQISPNQVWHAAKSKEEDKDVDHFCSELGWREFSYNLLYYNPDLPFKNLQSKFDKFPWRQDPESLKKWQTGKTGIPIVDAGMRQLWQTGYMHNRLRMIVGSFLVKNLLLHWHHGERWFNDCLVDADLANNSASWQWIAGCGADAAPYFRIFNPVTQGQKFDAEGKYILRYVPELEKLPIKYLFSPWQAPEKILQDSGIKLGVDYPRPIADLSLSRERALEAFHSL